MLYGFFFLVVAVWSIALAIDRGGWTLLLVWPGMSFGIVSGAYLGLGPGVFGKRDDGKLAWWAMAPSAPYLLLTWLIWYAYRFRGECWNEIVPGLFLGRRAWPGELPEEVDLVVDLTCEFGEPRGVIAGRSYLCLPTLDARVPHEGRFRELIERVAAWPGKAYVHCAMGHGRSGTTVMGVLLARQVVATVAEAEAMVRRGRPGVRLKPVQRRLLEKLFPLAE
ncbi:MAG: hypothetical protein AB7K24_06725 [Gemmataceae bacterium]